MTPAGNPARYRDPDGLWAGHAARFRVLLVNTNVLKGPPPSSVLDLASPVYARGSVGMAMPLFGTTAGHAAALYAVLGVARARSFFQQVSDSGVRIVDGNATVRDLVAQGVLMWGITDSDDALVAIKRGDPVSVIVPDQKGMGTLVIPSSIAAIRGSPHAKDADSLVRVSSECGGRSDAHAGRILPVVDASGRWDRAFDGNVDQGNGRGPAFSPGVDGHGKG